VRDRPADHRLRFRHFRQILGWANKQVNEGILCYLRAALAPGGLYFRSRAFVAEIETTIS
jgi:hypothetical protein